jgi:hypothetical protein
MVIVHTSKRNKYLNAQTARVGFSTLDSFS